MKTTLASILLAAALANIPALAQMTGGDFAIENFRVGETQITAAAGEFALEAAIDSLPMVLALGDAEIFITLAGRQATITWTTPAAGYVLESSPALGPAARWDPVTPAPTGNSIAFDALDAPRFSRLRRP